MRTQTVRVAGQIKNMRQALISNHDRLEATRTAADLEALRKLETRTRVLVPLEALGHQSRRQARRHQDDGLRQVWVSEKDAE